MNTRLPFPRAWTITALLLVLPSLSHGDGPADNQPTKIRQVPPPGIELPSDVRKELLAGVEQQDKRLLELAHPDLSSAEQRKRELCEVLSRGVRMTVATDMFYNKDEIQSARELLKLGAERLEQLDAGASEFELLGARLPHGESHLTQPLPVVGGYRSRIDNSVQPYGLVIPTGWTPASKEPMRMDVWLHGRGEKVSEVAFLRQRMRQLGEFTPDKTLVLHPYGRYCNAFKFAGEIDVIEAIEHVKQMFPIDEGRITIRGFSMGGAGCWQLAVHYPNLWAAASPGAGFSETTEFLRLFQREVIHPSDFQQRLLHWYDCPDWTNNDRQKQAADVMEAAFAARGMKLPHIIGPDTEHKIHADSKIEIERFLHDALKEAKPRVPRTVDLTTFMLRYHELGWLSIEGLEEHWLESRVQGEWFEADDRIELTTKRVTHLKLQFPVAEQDGDKSTGEAAPQGRTAERKTSKLKIAELNIDGQVLQVAQDWRDPRTPLRLIKDAQGTWAVDRSSEFEAATALRKRPGLQGPIDDAFMDAFNMMPSSPPQSQTGSDAAQVPVDEWADAEFRHAAQEWQRQFRGDPPVGDLASGAPLSPQQNMVLFGRPSTNKVLAMLLDKLPIEWDDETLVVNGKSYSAKTHVLVMIYPNPLEPRRYLVLNSGVTYREYAQLNNARQVPMLPDWAVVDVREGATGELPGKIVDAGFFDEHWQFK